MVARIVMPNVRGDPHARAWRARPTVRPHTSSFEKKYLANIAIELMTTTATRAPIQKPNAASCMRAQVASGPGSTPCIWTSLSMSKPTYAPNVPTPQTATAATIGPNFGESKSDIWVRSNVGVDRHACAECAKRTE